MSVAPTARAVKTALPQTGDLPASRSTKGYRVVRPVQPPAAEVSKPGLLGAVWLLSEVWQYLRALWLVTPEQWHARQQARQTGSDGGGLRGRMLISGERVSLLSPPDTSAFSRRFSQGDLP